jgi:signal transduction histidine kinase
MQHAGKLFQPFQRLHREEEFPGLGIGLATVQRIIRRHGGTIAGAGTPGAGASFTFTLPK